MRLIYKVISESTNRLFLSILCIYWFDLKMFLKTISTVSKTTISQITSYILCIYWFYLKMFLKTRSAVSKTTISQITSSILSIVVCAFILVNAHAENIISRSRGQKDINEFTASKNLHKKKIFVFDFDLTLTIVDTSKLKKDYNLISIFGKHLDKIRGLFKKIKAKNNLIFINTANNVPKVKNILTKAKLIRYIEEIYGAVSVKEANSPSLYSYLWKNNSKIPLEHKWAIIKCYFLNKIKNRYKGYIIYFFDDLDINIEKAKQYCKNCFIVKKGHIPSTIEKVTKFLIT